MNDTLSNNTPNHKNPNYTRLIGALAEDLRTTNYTNAGIEPLLGSQVLAALDRERPLPARRAIAHILESEDSNPDVAAAPETAQAPLAALVSVWMLGDPVQARLIDAALPQLGAAGAEELELGRVEQQMFHPTVDLSPYQSDDLGDAWICSDQTALQLRAPLGEDYVLGVGGASKTLVGITLRPEVQTALDLGTGCGIQTLHLLGHARHVTATDLSTRALEFTRFNVLLNAQALGVDPDHLEDRVSLVQGNMLEPVAGKRFDLVVSNPPFVISANPSVVHTYRETGQVGDAAVAELIRSLGSVLVLGGSAVLLANWEIHSTDPAEPEQGWDTRLRQWIADSGVDGWVIQRETQDPAEYAEMWLQDSSDERNEEEYERGYLSYLRDFEARGVSAVGFGYVLLHRPAEGVAESASSITQGATESAGEPAQQVTGRKQLIRTEELTGVVQQPVGPAWREALGRWQRLREPDDVVGLHLVAPHHVTEEIHQHFGAADPNIIMARQGAGFCRSVQLDSASAGLMGAMDGELAAGQLIAAVAGLLDLDSAAQQELTRFTRELVIAGFLDELH